MCSEGHVCTSADTPGAAGGLSTNETLAIVDTVLVGVLMLAGVIGIGFVFLARAIAALEHASAAATAKGLQDAL